MHQCLIQWIGDTVEVVAADSSYSIASAEVHGWNFERISYFSRQAWEADFLKATDYEFEPIQAVKSEDGA